jgi:hypothetical protein
MGLAWFCACKFGGGDVDSGHCLDREALDVGNPGNPFTLDSAATGFDFSCLKLIGAYPLGL